MNLALWAEEQKAALIDAGVHPHDAERAVSWVVDHLPPGQDPDTWLPAREVVVDAVRAAQREAIVDAKAAWYSDDAVPSRFTMLLDASPVASVDDAEKTPSGAGGLATFVYAQAQNHFYDAQGLRPVAEASMMRLLDAQVSAAERRVSDLASAVYRDEIAPSVWQRQMQVELRRANMHARALGSGGFANMGANDYLPIDANLMDDYNRIQKFARDIMEKELSLPQTQQRAEMYVGSARQQFFDGKDDHHATPDGMIRIERRFLRPADHCEDCIRYESMGWQKPGVLPAPGANSQCKSRCKCGKHYFDIFDFELEDWIGTKRRPLTDKEDLARVQQQERVNRQKAGLDPVIAPRREVAPDAQVVEPSAPAGEVRPEEKKAPIPIFDRLGQESDPVVRRGIIEQYIRETAVPAGVAKVHGMPSQAPFDSIDVNGQKVHFVSATKSSVVQSIDSWHQAQQAEPIPVVLTQETKNIYFVSDRNEKDAYWEKVYNMPGFTSLATGGGGNIVVYSNHVLDAGAYTHEMGHNLATKLYGVSQKPTPGSDFAAAAAREVAPSSYAAVALSEDFAESIRMFLTQRPLFMEIAPRRATVIERILRTGGERG
jgi:hypothetical protein